MLEDSDINRVHTAQRGDREALGALLSQEYDRIWAICRRILGNNADADDAAQEALIRIAKSIASFDGRSKFSTWAYRIASNCAIDEVRRRNRRRATSLDRVGDDGRVAEVADHSSQEQIDRIGDVEAFNSALAQIDDDFRVPLVMRDVGTLSYAEIADSLDIPVGTVKSRIARGRRLLIEVLSWNQTASNNVQAGPDDQ